MNEKPIAIVGAGLVGSLLGIYLSQRGYKVELFERRDDMRVGNMAGGKSINLALSDRGWKALKGVGIADEIMKIAIPMKGRMTHDVEGKTNFLPYGKEGQAIYSVSRAGLNCLLMDLAEQKGSKIHFNKRCKSISLKEASLIVEDPVTKQENHFYASRIFGTDGAFSAARLQMQLSTDRFEYSQHYLDYGYKELHIPPTKNGEFAMDKNCLHIWPRGKFMMIALPNIDGSFTCTLFFPFEGEESFSTLTTKESAKKFFDKTFPDAVPLMPTLLDDFSNNPSASLVTVRCFPWSVDDKMLLLGDAAHAIVPFYGQGMNCGFEDCTTLNEIMDKYLTNPHDEAGWKKVFEETEKLRKPNSDAIADLAVANFVEMRDLVTHPDFILQKKIEAYFSTKHPDKWLPLYSMVTFSDLPYSYALERGRKQDMIMKKVLGTSNVSEKWNSTEVEEMMIDLVKNS
ncbi:MAG TPA: NAD(P)/FAD-dependent oxidoreductase [Bacteroidia bacterium]|jgi:kynurenine 3-monooxygenase|nr:NAD(P)/FAD-dependent oxidoreductase [Bacteroidia bacterium]